jgi:lysophospholipase L1-like esterase
MKVKYILGSAVVFPLLPFMYIQGTRIRRKVPALPEATGPEGNCHKGSGRMLKLLYLGESTIAGVGVQTHAEGFAGTLSQLLSQKYDAAVEWKVYAKSGYTALEIHKKMLPLISENTADLIVIGLGGNDAFTLNTPWKWKSHIRELIFSIQKQFVNTPVLFLNMPPIKEFPAFTPLIKFAIGNLVEMLGEELAVVVGEFKDVHYCAQNMTMADWAKKLDADADVTAFFSDGVHPAKITYQLWAKDILMFIEFNKILT